MGVCFFFGAVGTGKQKGGEDDRADGPLSTGALNHLTRTPVRARCTSPHLPASRSPLFTSPMIKSALFALLAVVALSHPLSAATPAAVFNVLDYGAVADG